MLMSRRLHNLPIKLFSYGKEESGSFVHPFNYGLDIRNMWEHPHTNVFTSGHSIRTAMPEGLPVEEPVVVEGGFRVFPTSVPEFTEITDQPESVHKTKQNLRQCFSAQIRTSSSRRSK